MPSILHLAPDGSGKTEFVIDRLIEVIHGQQAGLAKVWVLLATRRQVLSFRQRLAQRDKTAPALFNVEFFDFYALYSHLLNSAAVPARRIERQTQTSLLRSLTQQLYAEGQLTHFNQIAHTRGFISIVGDLINELKQNGVDADDFQLAARSDKDCDIAKIYQLYQDTLKEHNLVDPEGEGWLALATLRVRAEIVKDIDLMLVDGFDQFTPVQAQILAELALHIPSIELTLTAPPEPSTGLLRRSALTQQRLRAAHSDAESSFAENILAHVDSERHPALEALGRAIFTGTVAAGRGEAICMIAMPSAAEEVKAVLRRAKSLLYAGVPADEILIALRDWQRYAKYFQQAQIEYGLPLLLHHQAPLHTLPVIAVLIDLLELAPHFVRGDLLDVLRSPYISSGLSSQDINLLERITFEQQFTRGSKEDWLQLLRLSKTHSSADDAENKSIAVDRIGDLIPRLSVFLDGITAPQKGDVATFVSWIEQLIGTDAQADPGTNGTGNGAESFSLCIASRITEGTMDEKAILRRDVAAINSLKNILREQLKTDSLLRSRLGRAGYTLWSDFWLDLKDALQNSSELPRDPSRENRILVTTASEARGLPHQHVFVPGLAEAIFPAELAEDPLYFDGERLRLTRQGVPLQVQADRSDDRSLFYELISLPRESLTLSRPTVKEGKIWMESYLWRAVKRVFPKQPVETMAVGQIADPAQAASVAELMLAVADRLNDRDHSSAANALRQRDWLGNHQRHGPSWLRILRGRRIEMRRLSAAPYDQYSGHLKHPDLRAEAARRLGAEHAFSATALKDYGLCGFRYYAKRLLKLDEFSEPEEGYDMLQLGSLYHKILEETYRTIKDLGIAIREDKVEQALLILEQAAADALDSAPQDFGFRASVTWRAEQQVLLRRLRALVKQDFSGESPLSRLEGTRYVHDVERRFAIDQVDLPNHDQPLRIHGLIDRIDIADGKLLVVDYKTGSTSIPRSEMEIGRDFQMMIYAMTMINRSEADHRTEQLAGGMFWHLRGLKASGEFDMENEDDMAAFDTALAHIAENLRMGRQGRFPVHPTKIEAGKCARYCEYAHLCRMQVTNRHKIRGSDA